MARPRRKKPAEPNENTILFEKTERVHLKKRPVIITPKNIRQEEYLDLLMNDRKSIIFSIGPAGTGKTLLAMMVAIKYLKEGKVSRLVLTRPAVEVEGERHGFLPGDLTSKMQPWTQPLMDVVLEYFEMAEINKMIEEKIIAIEPLAYLRGRTLKNSFIVFDEAQNSTPNQMKMMLTRIGEGSKMVITGDLAQVDRKYTGDNNGLGDFIDRLDKEPSNLIDFVEFDRTDVLRHPVVCEVLKLYGELD